MDGRKRLGSGNKGFLDIRNHPFFAGVDWVRFGQLKETPPFFPKPSVTSTVIHKNFESMVTNIKSKKFTAAEISPENNKYFTNWYVCSLVMFAVLLCGCLCVVL